LGRALVERALADTRRSGASTVSLGIIAAQKELRDWYESIGFIVTETKAFPHLPFHVTLMAYTIR
jgi:predicted GNAT family N-acyltransferase